MFHVGFNDDEWHTVSIYIAAFIVYNDELIRQIIEVVIVESKEKIKIIFKGGLTVEENL